MKPLLLSLRALMTVAMFTVPLAADAKPAKDERKKREFQSADGDKKKTSKSAERSAQNPAPRPERSAKAGGEKKSSPERRAAANSGRAKPSGNYSEQRRVSAPEKPASRPTAKAQNQRKAAPVQEARPERVEISEARPSREVQQAKRKQQRSDVSAEPEVQGIAQNRKAEKQAQAAEKRERRGNQAVETRERQAEKIAERREARVDSEQEKQLRKSERATQDALERADRKEGRARTTEEKRERAENRVDRRADRREAREESAEERDRRAERVKTRQQLAQHRQRQNAERRERQHDRVERFRENRQDRLAKVVRQRRTIQETRVETRREYVQEVRADVRGYWEDRAEETRYRVGDRCDNLFDDNWWETRHWHRGPLLVSDPWWWWRPARFDAINVFLEAGWNEPVAYDYGTDVIYDDAVVHVRGERVGTRADYSRGVVRLANPVIAAADRAPLVENDWRSLGVWALVQEAQGDAVMFFQLSVDRQGLISGAFTNVVSGEELPVTGQVDRATQRAAWHIGEQTEKVFEAGLANLTQEQASCLVHFKPGEMQTWLLVRLPDPSLPNQPASLSNASRERGVFALARAMR